MNLLKKSGVQTKQLDFLKEYEKKLQQFFKEETESTTKSAIADAVHPPLKGVDTNTLPEPNKRKYACSKMLAGITKNAVGILDNFLTAYEQTNARIRENSPTNKKVVALQASIKGASTQLAQDFSDRDSDLHNSETELKAELKNHKLDLQNKTKHALLLPSLAVIILLLVISGSEVFYTAKAFELTGLNFYERIILAVGLGLSSAFIGVGLIEVLRSNWNYVWKIVGAVSSFAMILSVFYVIGKIRVDLLKKEMASGVEFSDLSAFDFLLINLIFFVAIVLIHWLIWPPKDKFRDNLGYNKVQDQIDKTKKEIKQIQTERSNLPNELLKEQSKVSVTFDKQITEIETEFVNLEAKRSESQTVYNNVYGRLVELYAEINFFYKETVGLYITTMNRYRNDGVFLTMDEPLEDLPNPFRNFKYIENSPSEFETTEKELSDITLNFDELLTNTNNKNYEKVQTNN